MLAEARTAAVVMAGALASFGAALVLERLVGLHADVVVLAVVLAITLGRRGAARAARGRHGRADEVIALIGVPLVAIAASQLATVMRQHEYLGDALFAIAVSCSVYVRRFGPLAARIGGLAAMPFIAMLIVPIPIPLRTADHSGGRVLWSAVVAMIAVACAGGARVLAEHTGFLPRATPLPPAAGVSTVDGAAARRVPASTRVAAQLAVALAAAFVAGHLLFGRHWPWPVLTAYILCSPNLGRADVAYRSVLRLAGALAGVIPATLLSGLFPARAGIAIVLIFVVLGLGSWLRGLNYAFWAAAVTAALSLLYGYYGDASTAALTGRLGGILCGAVIGVAASWLVLPLRTSAVLRRRAAAALAALTDLLAAVAADRAEVPAHQARYEHALAELRPLGQPLRAQRLVTRRWRAGPYGADTVDGLQRALPPARAIAAWVAGHPDTPLPAPAARRRAGALAQVVAARRALRTGAVLTPPAPEPPPRPAEPGLDSALAELRSALGLLPVAGS